jgi:hypothetical protein
MNKFTLLMWSCLLALSGCGQATIEGEYKALEGKVGIFQMNTMTVQKSQAGNTYNVNFTGSEKTLSYENVEFKDGELKINDKGFQLPIKIDGSKAEIEQGGAKFERITK